MQRTGIKSNLRKYFLILFTARRNFIPLLSIYYLSFGNTSAQEIGRYSAAGYVASFLMNIPAGYIGDKRGQKSALVISKICLVASSTLFVIGGNFRYFFAGAILLSLGANAFATGNISAFLHDTLGELGKEAQFKKISSSIRGRVSFISIFFIVTLPFFTTISMKLPFMIGLGIDVLGLIVAITLYNVRSHAYKQGKLTSIKSLRQAIKTAKGTNFYPLAVFSAIIGGFLMGDGVFRTPYLQSLGYPIIYIGFVMGLSRLVRFIVGQYAHKIEEHISLKKLMFLEILLFSGYYISAARTDNPFVVGVIFSLVTGYFRGRSEIYTDHLIKRIPDQGKKATFLSIKGQIAGIFEIGITFSIGFVMSISYKTGFLTLGIAIAIALSIAYIFFVHSTRNHLKSKI